MGIVTALPPPTAAKLVTNFHPCPCGEGMARVSWDAASPLGHVTAECTGCGHALRPKAADPGKVEGLPITVYECLRCQSHAFRLMSSGRVFCNGCDHLHSGLVVLFPMEV